jgi:hypothetical protein
MSVTYGFYNSVNGDKTYSATDFSKIFDGIITDGIIKGYGNALAVTAAETNMSISVGIGRAWFNHTWTHNDQLLSLPIQKPSSTNKKRIDTVVVEVDLVNRKNDIIVVQGPTVPSTSTATPAALKKGTGNIYQYPLAYVHVDGSKAVITGSDVEDRRGLASDGTPFVTGAVQSLTVDELLAQCKSSFAEWFGKVKDILEDPGAELVDLDARVGDAEQFINMIAPLQKAVNGSSVINKFWKRRIFRGKNLGTTVTAAQWTEITRGRFNDLYVGDYWQINGQVWRIADIGYWYNTGGNKFTKHHVVIVPDGRIHANPFSLDASSLATGLANIPNLKNTLASCEQAATAAFGSEHILEHQDYQVTYVNADLSIITARADLSLKLQLLNEPMVFGGYIHAAANGENRDTYSHQQLALFSLCPELVNTRYNYWLRDIVDQSHLAMVHSNGFPYKAHCNDDTGYLRPVFAIG